MGHFARDCYKKKYDEFKHKNRKHASHFAEEERVKPDFQNLRLFISEATLSAKINDSNAWFIDFGASIHMSYNKYWFENYQETNNGVNIYLGDDRSHQVKGYGDISLTLPDGSVT